MNRVRRAVLTLLAFERPGRNLDVLGDDVYLVSYPKSGNTWLRFLVGNLVRPDSRVTFANLEERVPDIYTARQRHLKKVTRPRYLKSHEPFDARYPRVIYMGRDPRDVLLSYQRHKIKFGGFPWAFPFGDFARAFIEGK